MKKTCRNLIVVLSTVGCASSIAFGAQASPDTSATLEQIQAQISGLQKQVYRLESKQVRTKKSDGIKKADETVPAHEGESFQATLPRQAPFQWAHLGDSVVVAPFVGKPTFYSGGQLVVNAPSINEDEKLLYRRYLNEVDLLKAGQESFPQPRLVLSGKVEAQVMASQPYYTPFSTDVDLTAAELDALAEVTPWVSGFMAFSYDNGLGTENRRVSNSKISLNKGFITIGNFHKSSFFGSIGQMYIPFGRYQSSMISSPVTKGIGKTKARAISMSYIMPPKDDALISYVRVFAFKGDAQVGNANIVKQYGADTGLWYGNPVWNGEVGASYISSLADSEGMQDNGVTSTAQFQGFSKTSGGAIVNPEVLAHDVKGVSIYTSMAYTQFNLLAEYVTALQQFGSGDMTYNAHGAKPSAFNIEGAYSFNMLRLPSSFAIGYGRTAQALALNLPEQRYSATISSTILANTTLSLEYRHDVNYVKSDDATGNGMIAYNQNALGKTDNIVTAQIGVYF